MELNNENYEELSEEDRRAARTALFDYMMCMQMEMDIEWEEE